MIETLAGAPATSTYTKNVKIVPSDKRADIIEQNIPTSPVYDDMQLEDRPSPVRSKTTLFAVLSALYFSLFIAALNQTIISTAVPTIAEQLSSHGGSGGYTWIGGAYFLANAAGSPIVAKMSDIWGRKPIMMASLALFFLSSLMCALSISMTMLIAGRSLQGIGGGALFSMVAIIISDLFSMKDRTTFFGIMEVMWTFAAGLGPVLGGVFAKVNWRWCFYINLPISGLALILIVLFLDVHNPRTKLVAGLKAMDWVGMIAILGLVLMLLLGLEFGGSTFPWNSPKVICLIIFGSLFSVVFIYAEKRIAKYPLIPLDVFSNRSNIAGLVITCIHSFAFTAPEYWLPLYLQSVKGATPLRSGVISIPFAVGASITGIMSAVFMSRTSISYRELTWAGSIVLTLGDGLLILLNPDSSIAVIVAVQAHTAQHNIATATATLGFGREVAAAISIVIGGVVFQNGMKSQRSNLVAAGASPELIRELSGAEAAASTRLVRAISNETVKAAVKAAFSYSLRNMWILYTCVAVINIVAAAFITKKVLSTEHTETRTGIKEQPDIVRNE